MVSCRSVHHLARQLFLLPVAALVACVPAAVLWAFHLNDVLTLPAVVPLYLVIAIVGFVAAYLFGGGGRAAASMFAAGYAVPFLGLALYTAVMTDPSPAALWLGCWLPVAVALAAAACG